MSERGTPATRARETSMSELSTDGPMPAATADLIAVVDDSSATGGTRSWPPLAPSASSK